MTTSLPSSPNLQHLKDEVKSLLKAHRNGIDRWLGGVHLMGGDALWRWDGKRRRLVTLHSLYKEIAGCYVVETVGVYGNGPSTIYRESECVR
jgi:hypothetical protein